MSDSSDDMEGYSDIAELFHETKLERALVRIINCDISEFKDQEHMINYIKKIAKNLLEDLQC